MLTLISATPSPYARKVRIALAEKKIAFTLQTEVPWDQTTQTPQYNPLEKVPVLILDDGKAVYESSFILEWIEAKFPEPRLRPPVTDIDDGLFTKQVEVVADGVCDALVLAFFEKMRDEDKQSKAWIARQMRKVDGGLKALATWVDEKPGDFVTPGGFGLADIAIGSVCGYLAVRWPEHGWKEQYPGLKKHWEMLETRRSFKDTVPSPQKITDTVV
ncbi:hypothetical protein AAFC00_004658 [Neodothiora populina]|uniref:Glutathione S-transferase domain-containing protein n=1 Tax=Neodothiora populina TaxID=2781224 RepID=A0ABR3P324_9PEZI